jgi:hypothetical protein
METADIIHDTTHVDRAIAHGQYRATARAKALARRMWISTVTAAALAFGAGILAASLAAAHAPSGQGPLGSAPFPRMPSPAPAVTPGKIVTDYVIFHLAEAAGGVVETGWHYSNQNEARPDRQWCQFRSSPDQDGKSVVIPIEKLPQLSDKCAWFPRNNDEI